MGAWGKQEILHLKRSVSGPERSPQGRWHDSSCFVVDQKLQAPGVGAAGGAHLPQPRYLPGALAVPLNTAVQAPGGLQGLAEIGISREGGELASQAIIQKRKQEQS